MTQLDEASGEATPASPPPAADSAVLSAAELGPPAAPPGSRAPGAPHVWRTRRAPDYRLRGVDLGTQSVGLPPSRPKLRRRRSVRARRVARWVVVAAVAVGAALFLREAVIEPFAVPSAAMAPTLHAGDRILVVKPKLLAGSVQRGEIVVFRHPAFYPCSGPGSNAQDLVQRVVGLSGETIWSSGGKIYVDGRQLHERGWYNHKSGQLGQLQIPRTRIPRGDYFVMGDNRAASCDSRAFGPIPSSSVVGKVVAVLLRGGHPHLSVF